VSAAVVRGKAAQGAFPLAGRPAAAAAIGCGLLYFLAFPGPDLWPLAFVALVPLIVALEGQTPKRAAWLGWLAGFTMTMIGFYWLLELLETFSGFPLPLCMLFTAILCGYQSGRIALLGWLYARVGARGYPGWLAFMLAFAASEQAFPLMFPWSYAATVHQLPALGQVAEIGGPILVAIPVVLANFAIAGWLIARRSGRAFDKRLWLVLLAAPVLSALYGAVRIPMVDARTAAAPKGRVGLVQANMSLMGKRQRKSEGLRRHLALTEQLKREGKLDLVVWSETSVMHALDESQVETMIPERFSRLIGVPALFGAVIVREVEDARRYTYYNSALATDAQGNVTGRFDKQELVLFSEGMPFGEQFPILYKWSPNSGKFVPGKLYDPLTVGEHQIATVICYEDIIPRNVNRIVNNGDPDLIANLTNDAWFGDTTEPWIHLALSQLRAVEHRRYFVRSTNSGVSAIIDPVGRVVAHTETFREAALAGEVAWLRGKTVYEYLGDVPWWLLSLATFVMAFVRRPGGRPDAAPSPVQGGQPTAPSGPALEDPIDAFRAKARAWFRR
jgi:apolipoprotein N-acyltransferase